MKKVLVTGADGFIGSHLTESLLEKGYDVKAFVYYNSFNNWGWLDTLPKEKLDKIEIFAGDVRDPNGVRIAMKGVDQVFHLAALIAIPFSYHSPDSYVDTNIKGTLNVLQAARDLGTEKIMVTSTSEVYGTAQYVPIDEKHPFQGQSPYQIVTNHPELDLSVRTLYSYLDKGILSARNIDLKRQVKFNPRKVHKTQIKDRSVFIRRMFSDFQALELDHFAEMDTVHSSQDSKRVILTFFLTREKLFLAFIMNRCTKGAVKLVFNKLEHQLGTYDFLTLFNTILTDRGSEFGDPESLENGINGIMRSSIYYCDPMRSGQKGGIEQAHTMLRMILPKKTSFEYLTQWDLRTIVDHINSTPRESLGGRTPYDVALENYGTDILKALQLRPIPPDEVNLTPKLIRFNH